MEKIASLFSAMVWVRSWAAWSRLVLSARAGACSTSAARVAPVGGEPASTASTRRCTRSTDSDEHVDPDPRARRCRSPGHGRTNRVPRQTKTSSRRTRRGRPGRRADTTARRVDQPDVVSCPAGGQRRRRRGEADADVGAGVDLVLDHRPDFVRLACSGHPRSMLHWLSRAGGDDDSRNSAAWTPSRKPLYRRAPGWCDHDDRGAGARHLMLPLCQALRGRWRLLGSRVCCWAGPRAREGRRPCSRGRPW